VAGRRDVLELATRRAHRVKFEGGTYSAHELSLVAAKTMLEHLVANESTIYPQLADRGEFLRRGLETIFRELGIGAWISGWPNDAIRGSSMVMLDLAAGAGGRPSCPEERMGPGRAHPAVDDELVRSLLLLEGVSARHGLGGVSLAHEDEDLARTLAGWRRVLERLREAGLA
jgi:glutamate-1-semialdehyde 2,1-aminomutase